MTTRTRAIVREVDGIRLLVGRYRANPPEIEKCLFCGEYVTDGSKESGWTGLTPDWMADGDFGCDCNPISGEDGVGGHLTLYDVEGFTVARELYPLDASR